MTFECTRCDEKFTKEAGHSCDKYIKQLEDEKVVTERNYVKQISEITDQFTKIDEDVKKLESENKELVA